MLLKKMVEMVGGGEQGVHENQYGIRLAFMDATLHGHGQGLDTEYMALMHRIHTPKVRMDFFLILQVSFL